MSLREAGHYQLIRYSRDKRLTPTIPDKTVACRTGEFTIYTDGTIQGPSLFMRSLGGLRGVDGFLEDFTADNQVLYRLIEEFPSASPYELIIIYLAREYKQWLNKKGKGT